jgi:hypothetical protein
MSNQQKFSKVADILNAFFNGAVSRSAHAVPVPDERKNMKHWWNNTDRGNPKYSEKASSQFHFVHHKTHLKRLGIEPVSPKLKAAD